MESLDQVSHSTQVEPGSTLGNGYRLKKVIGQGGMGTVFLAHSPKDDQVAIKALQLHRIDRASHSLAVKQFEEEARLLSELDHKGLVKVHGHYCEGNNHFLVMEYIDGVTLSQALKSKRGFLSKKHADGVMSQLCDVLQYLHTRERPVIFRDLKPSNIMLTKDLSVKLVDFGIARHFTDETQTQTFIKGVGSAGYAPLEQYGAGTTDPRSDIYSLGATFYTILTKTTPPPVVSVVAGVEKIVGIRTINPQVSTRTEAIIRRMMAIRKEQRFDSVAQVADYLFNPPKDSDDPTGTLTLAQERAEKAQLGPCLVCKRLGSDSSAFHPPHTPLSLCEIDLELQADLILGLKTEVDPQSGLHFQKDGRKKHATHVDLGFDGAAALVLAGPNTKNIKGPVLLSRIKQELEDMAIYLLENLESLSPPFRLSAVPILEQLCEKRPTRRVEILRAVYDICSEGADEDSAVLNVKRFRLARELMNSKQVKEAGPLFADCFQWFLEDAKLMERQGRSVEAGEARDKALESWTQSELCNESLGRLLSHWTEAESKAGRLPAGPYSKVLTKVRNSGDSLKIARVQLLFAEYMLENGDANEAKTRGENALGLAEDVLGTEDGELYPFVQHLATTYERLRLPEKLEMKSRGLILKYRKKKS